MVTFVGLSEPSRDTSLAMKAKSMHNQRKPEGSTNGSPLAFNSHTQIWAAGCSGRGGRGSQRVKQHPINRFILGNIRYVPKQILGNSNIRMTTPGSGSNTPRFISVAFLTIGILDLSIAYCNNQASFRSSRDL